MGTHHSSTQLQAIENLLQLAGELRREVALGNYRSVSEEVAALSARHSERAQEGERRLRTVQTEMQDALRELEASYYSSCYR